MTPSSLKLYFTKYKPTITELKVKTQNYILNSGRRGARVTEEFIPHQQEKLMRLIRNTTMC
jgi:hypothetical protein